MKGLIIKPKWADLILSGEKTWEIRGSQTHHRGTIGIIKSGSGLVFGTIELADCFPNLKDWQLEEFVDKHLIKDIRDIHYKNPHAWVMANPKIYPYPIPYKHPQGAVIWVNIPE